jgi:septal ring factor EnvC (AmiA/AmiB activator)
MFKKITFISFALFLSLCNIKAQDVISASTENQLNQLKTKIQAQQKIINKNTESLKSHENIIAEMGAEITRLKNDQVEQLQAFESKTTSILEATMPK